MARTTSAAVQSLLETGGDYDTDAAPSLDAFLATATAMVDRVETCASTRGRTLSSTELELIERWLAAHFYAMADQTYASKATADASATFHGRTGMSLEATKYGQTALSVDYSGCLGSIGKRKRVGGAWLGRAPSEQTDYVDRD